MSAKPEHLLVFGASGVIGAAICRRALGKSWRVTGAFRSSAPPQPDGLGTIVVDPLSPSFQASDLAVDEPYTAVCWAQGMNTSDSVFDFQKAKHLEMYNANCVFILESLKALLEAKLLVRGSRLCVVSSIWQELARQNKLSYCVTKAALQGLVLSASVDLAPEGHLVNAILPGAVDTPMTRANLSPAQIDNIAGGTGFHRLTTLEDVASMACYLCSPENTGVTGQFISVDLGWSRARIV